jgi:DMSO/TMAO reductase YedYZ molybdopterin-dependent catalytic subunit
MNGESKPHLPPGQQLVASGKWPIIGEREPASLEAFQNGWKLTIGGCIEKPVSFSLNELRQFPVIRPTIDIHCVTRWSKLGVVFEGVLLADLLQSVRPTATAKFISFISHSPRSHSSSLSLATALEQKTLIAFAADDSPLGIDHGGPIRNIVPGRYFYKSVKWLTRIELLDVDQLGYWEAESGYHNEADPWREQRYLASTLDRREMAELIASNDFSGRNLLGILASNRDLRKLNARQALLRNATFERSDLQGADFSGANLSNANLQHADLRNCNFQGADLEGANFTSADLRGANLLDCSLIGSSFFDPEIGWESGAKFDTGTQIKESVIAPLFPEQLKYLEQKCRELNLFRQ